MKKILVVFNGAQFPYHVLEQAITMAVGDNSLLVGVFLRPPLPSETVYPFLNDLALTGSGYYVRDATSDEAAIIKTNITLFKDTCNTNNVNHTVHLDKGTPTPELLKESMFADLVVIDAKADLYDVSSILLSSSLREFLADSHCPVLVVHEKAQLLEKVVLAYDGSVSSIHAIKMFSYLFPHLRNLPTYLVSATEGSVDDVPHSANINALLGLHFTNVHTVVLQGDAKVALSTYLAADNFNGIAVMGAYGRNAVSRLLKQSLANHIISQTKVPLFITHQ